ncbi:hypothetical protein LguiB_013588 [Lonicera macranthoides]
MALPMIDHGSVLPENLEAMIDHGPGTFLLNTFAAFLDLLLINSCNAIYWYLAKNIIRPPVNLRGRRQKRRPRRRHTTVGHTPDPITLSYAFSPKHIIRSARFSDIKAVFQRSFSRWSAVIPVNFVDANSYYVADIKIGFYSGHHKDCSIPFDGPKGFELAHASDLEEGQIHINADIAWFVDLDSLKSRRDVDLESVAIHEIGHILGLENHSSDPYSVMYSSQGVEKIVDLTAEDVKRIQKLYGRNPKFDSRTIRNSGYTMVVMEVVLPFYTKLLWYYYSFINARKK